MWIREEIVYLVQIEAAWKDRAQLNSFPLRQKINWLRERGAVRRTDKIGFEYASRTSVWCEMLSTNDIQSLLPFYLFQKLSLSKFGSKYHSADDHIMYALGKSISRDRRHHLWMGPENPHIWRANTNCPYFRTGAMDWKEPANWGRDGALSFRCEFLLCRKKGSWWPYQAYLKSPLHHLARKNLITSLAAYCYQPPRSPV